MCFGDELQAAMRRGTGPRTDPFAKHRPAPAEEPSAEELERAEEERRDADRARFREGAFEHVEDLAELERAAEVDVEDPPPGSRPSPLRGGDVGTRVVEDDRTPASLGDAVRSALRHRLRTPSDNVRVRR